MAGGGAGHKGRRQPQGQGTRAEAGGQKTQGAAAEISYFGENVTVSVGETCILICVL